MPFPVLLDVEGEAAAIVETNSLKASSFIRPDALLAGGRSLFGGHRQHKAGARPMQLGATLVVGPGDELLYLDRESFAGDHADLDEVLEIATS